MFNWCRRAKGTIIDNLPDGSEPAPPPRQIPLSTFILVLVLVVGLGAGAIAWILVSGDDSDGEVAQTPRTTTTEPADEDADDEVDDDDSDGATDDLLDDDSAAAALDCLGGLDSLIGGERTEVPDDDPRAQYEAVARAVEEERELTFETIPEPTFVTQDEMRDRLAAVAARDYPDDVARADEELLTAYGAIEPGTDLTALQIDLLGDQVAGYYDPATGELVVLGDDAEPFDAIELTIIAHELEHALADQALGLPIDEDPRTDDPDGATAGRALGEGDATLTQTNFQLSALDPADMLSMLSDPSLAAAEEALEDAPPFLAKQLGWPYEEGLAFVCELHGDGGWEAVDEAYRNPPTTTAQILFPELYEAGVGAVDAPDPVQPDGAAWEEVRHMTFGAADLMFLLDIAGVDDARDVVEGWAGGEVRQWRRGDEAAVRISIVTTEADDEDFCAAVTQWTDSLADATTTCEGTTISIAL